MTKIYQHLGIYSDLVVEARRQSDLFPIASPGRETQVKVRAALGFNRQPEESQEVRLERRWEQDGVAGEEISWWVGYGPRTHAYLLKPAGATGRLPGVVALHDHSGFFYYGKEKIADADTLPDERLVDFRDGCYGGRAYANALAKAGFLVLAPDVFLWGSRRFQLESMPFQVQEAARTLLAAETGGEDLDEIALVNTAANLFEHYAAKYANVLGSSIPGIVAHEDRIAVNYLLSRPEVDAERVGCIGLSGGGNRAGYLQATHDGIRAAVVVGLMTTYEGLLDHNMAHSWLLFPFHWSRYGDYPDLVACRAPSPLLVQYALDDELFTLEGMQAAHRRLQLHYASTGKPENYCGQFYPGWHRFDVEMQTAACAWLKAQLAG